MSDILSPTWLQMLNYLMVKSQRDGVFERVTSLALRRKAVNTFWGNSFYRKKLLEWITFVKRKRGPLKSRTHSSKLRAHGNEKLKCKDYASSVELFTESMAHASYNSKEMAFAVANRSAALFYLGAYEECLKDIELAFCNNYPEHLKYKLYTRKASCMTKLERYKEAIDSYNIVLELLKISNLDDAGEKELQITTKKTTVEMKLNECHDVGTSGESETKSVETIPVVTYGESDTFASASAVLHLGFNPSKGRYVVTEQDIKVGDIMFVEKPYAFVLLPDYCRHYCHHCRKSCTAPIPCMGCTKSFYCGNDCRDSSWQEYHKYECSGGLELSDSVGQVHLALRIVLKADPLCSENFKFIQKSQDNFDWFGEFGNKHNKYPVVYSLISHIKEMQNEEFFMCALTATLLLVYLKETTEYFDNRQLTENIESLHTTDKSEKNIDSIGRLLLRHTAQMRSNSQAITNVQRVRDVYNFSTEPPICIGTAIYPSVSMMNHSCNPNTFISFRGEYIVVHASRGISAGSEVFNCYGPHFRQAPVKKRQETLKSQYFFTCSCDCCTDPAMIESDKHFSAWLCQQCSGPLVSNKEFGNYKQIRILRCCDCGLKVRADTVEHYIDQANDFNEEGVQAANNGDIEKALLMLKQCLYLREKYLYKKNADISRCLLQLAMCYEAKGDFHQGFQFLKRSATMSDDEFGETNTVLANEMQKITDFSTYAEGKRCYGPEFLKKMVEAQISIKRVEAILKIVRGKSTNSLQDILDK